MSRSPEERAVRYRNYAAFLRLLAARTRADAARARLRKVADQFDRLAAGVQRAQLVA